MDSTNCNEFWCDHHLIQQVCKLGVSATPTSSKMLHIEESTQVIYNLM